MSLHRSDATCEPCLAYRRGERENLAFGPTQMHVCDRHDPDAVSAEGCPCGCEMRDPAEVESDRELHGDVYLNALGGRIDPARVWSTGLLPESTAPLTWSCHACGRVRDDADVDCAVEEGALPSGVAVRTSARYCADSADCEAGARELARQWLRTATGP